jgi:uncharacterized protein
MNQINVLPDQEIIDELCQRYHIKRLSLFGSVLRDDFRADSDIDVLVEFEEGKVPGFAFFAIQEELSQLFGRPVELHTAEFLSPHFRGKVIKEAQVQYDRA